MTMLASQITSLTVVYSIVYSGVNQRKHQSSASLAFVREIHRGPVNFPHKWPVTRKMFPFDDVIMKRSQYRVDINPSPTRSVSSMIELAILTQHITTGRIFLIDVHGEIQADESKQYSYFSDNAFGFHNNAIVNINMLIVVCLCSAVSRRQDTPEVIFPFWFEWKFHITQQSSWKPQTAKVLFIIHWFRWSRTPTSAVGDKSTLTKRMLICCSFLETIQFVLKQISKSSIFKFPTWIKIS